MQNLINERLMFPKNGIFLQGRYLFIPHESHEKLFCCLNELPIKVLF